MLHQIGFEDASSWGKLNLQINKVLDHLHLKKTALNLEKEVRHCQQGLVMPSRFYWTVKICYHSTRRCNRLKFKSMKTFVPFIQNTLMVFRSANRTNCTIKETPHNVSSCSFSVYRVRKILQTRARKPALIKSFQSVSPICVDEVHSLVKYHTKLWEYSSKQRSHVYIATSIY